MQQHSLFKSFDKQSIHTLEDVERFVWNTDLDVIDSFVKEIQDIIEDDKTKCTYSPFMFYPNPDLSGIGGCNETMCKLKRARKFSLFASLYADTIFLPLNPVSTDAYILQGNEDEDIYKHLYDVENLLALLLAYRDLINAGIARLSINRSGICNSCLNRVLQHHQQAFSITDLIKQYINQATISIEKDEFEKGKYLVSYANVANLVPGNHIIREYTAQDIPELKYYSMQKKVVKALNLKKKLLSDLILSVIGEAYETSCFAQMYQAKMITDVPFDLHVAQILQENRQETVVVKELRNQAINYDLPILGNLSVDKILQLREKMQDSFNRYRNSINNFIQRNHNNSAIDIRKIYALEIYPQFTELVARIHEVKSQQLSRLIGEGLILSSALGVGYTLGLISSVSQAIEAAGGIATIVHNATDTIFKFQEKKQEIKRNPYFFLWKLKNAKK